MAVRARLVAPAPEPKTEWPWHSVKQGSIPVSVLFAGDRRFEAETYLSSGFGIRTAIQAHQSGWRPLADLARVSKPNRFRAIQVSPEYGTPFLSATQVFDMRPFPRKFLAPQRMADADAYFVKDGQILVTRSGSVGRPALTHAPHRDTIISDDLLRVGALSPKNTGWLYAYLLARQVRAMTTSAHYGHIIKHLETTHLDVMPVPLVTDSMAEHCNGMFNRILSLRNDGYRLTLEAEARFEEALGRLEIADWGESGFAVSARGSFLSGRRRLDASRHNPGVRSIYQFLTERGKGFTTLTQAGFDVWVPGRYKRIPAEDGIIYRDSADLLEINPDLPKRYADCAFGDKHHGRVKNGWILVACSGQVYGIIGSAILATEALDGQVVSNHVLRAAPRKSSVAPGYIVTALTHPRFGRPLVKALAFGSSVPEIDETDFSELSIVRLDPTQEAAIADLAEASAKARAEADILEQRMSAEAEHIIDDFIAGSPLSR